MHGGQGGSGIDAELLGQRSPDVLIRRQRVRLPARRLERIHQLIPQPLAQRVLGRQFLQLGHQLGAPPQGQLSVDPVFASGQPQLRQPGDRGRGERGVRDIGQRRAAPLAQRPGQQRRSLSQTPVGQRAAARANLLLEGTRIHAIVIHHEPVAGWAELHGVPADRTSQPRDQRLHRICRVGRRLTVPQVLGQPLDRDRPPVGDGQPDQQGTQQGPADGQQEPGVVADLQRPQDADLHSRLPRASRPCPLSPVRDRSQRRAWSRSTSRAR